MDTASLRRRARGVAEPADNDEDQALLELRTDEGEDLHSYASPDHFHEREHGSPGSQEVQRLEVPVGPATELAPGRQHPTVENDQEHKALDANSGQGLEIVGQEMVVYQDAEQGQPSQGPAQAAAVERRRQDMDQVARSLEYMGSLMTWLVNRMDRLEAQSRAPSNVEGSDRPHRAAEAARVFPGSLLGLLAAPSPPFTLPAGASWSGTRGALLDADQCGGTSTTRLRHPRLRL